jgi:hypothetical protein
MLRYSILLLVYERAARRVYADWLRLRVQARA